MSTRPIRFFYRIAALTFLFPIFLAISPVLADPAPVPGPWGDDPEGFRKATLEHRQAEAESKFRLFKGMAAADAAKTANQLEFDVHHYDLDLTLDVVSQTLTGTVTTTAEVTGATIATLDLDLDAAMSVLTAKSGGSITSFSRAGDVLTVNLDRNYNLGETVVVTVDYTGNPAGSGTFGWSSHNGQNMIWTLSEPFGARDWWPCKDLNSDKADSVDIRVTVPDHLVVASQGLLQSDVDNGATRTFHWKSNYPIATYLVSLAIYPYTQYSDWYSPQGGGDDMEVQFFIYPDHVGTVETNYAQTVPMIGAFAGVYGEYPFVNEKYGHAEFTWGGGMEHQTISSMGGWSIDLISHELAHMWWGDMVTCQDFGHIWLNEGFATWSEAYWAEQAYGTATYRQYMDIAAYYGGGTIFVENPLTDNIFDSNLTYNKGSWIVHMLRGVLGDTNFFAGIQQYRSDNLYGTATTADLQAALEAVSGMDLTAFFQQWIYGTYYPVYQMDWVAGPGAGEVTVTVDQIQDNTGLFTMPLPLRIETDLGTTDVTVQNSLASESYVVPVPGSPLSVALDPDRWILRQVKTTVTNPSFDQGILLVNGVDWATYDTEITSAYDDSTFWGANPISFWDTFSMPAKGYPLNLPPPLGHGMVPAQVMGRYSTIIWVGNNYNGDLAKWAETPIQSYLEVGGNLLLLSRRSKSFLDGDLANYAGVTWAEGDAILGNCVAVEPGLVNIPFTGTQSWNDVYLTGVGPNSTLLFKDTSGFSGERGTGVLALPATTPLNRTDGGILAHIAGRPYRMDHDALRSNVEYILADMLNEPYDSPAPVGEAVPGAEDRVRLGSNYPNPFNPLTVIPFYLSAPDRVELVVYDARGRLVARVADGRFGAGDHLVSWDGKDSADRPVSSGTYFARLRTGSGDVLNRGLVLLK